MAYERKRPLYHVKVTTRFEYKVSASHNADSEWAFSAHFFIAESMAQAIDIVRKHQPGCVIVDVEKLEEVARGIPPEMDIKGDAQNKRWHGERGLERRLVASRNGQQRYYGDSQPREASRHSRRRAGSCRTQAAIA